METEIMSICWNLIQKNCKITSGEPIFGGFYSFWDHCAEKGRGNPNEFCQHPMSVLQLLHLRILQMWKQTNKHKEYVRRVWGFFEKNINDYLLVTKPIFFLFVCSFSIHNLLLSSFRRHNLSVVRFSVKVWRWDETLKNSCMSWGKHINIFN